MCGRILFFFFSSRRRHTRLQGDWSSDVCSSDLCCSRLSCWVRDWGMLLSWEVVETSGFLASALGSNLSLIEDLINILCLIQEDRKSTRLNSSHLVISYAVFCLKKKIETHLYRYI